MVWAVVAGRLPTAWLRSVAAIVAPLTRTAISPNLTLSPTDQIYRGSVCRWVSSCRYRRGAVVIRNAE